MYARQIETYTLEEAKRIINAEQSQKREEVLHKAKQKLLGVGAILASIIAPILLDGDVTISVFMLPIGLYQLFTRESE